MTQSSRPPFYLQGWRAVLGCALPISLSFAGPVASQATGADSASVAPNYHEPLSWAAWPERVGPADLVPAGALARIPLPEADVFYIHPTTYRDAAAWNQPIGDAETDRWTDASVIARQASIFNGCCRVFAPRYRQASSRAVGAIDGNGGKAFALAYSDIERAFDAFLEKSAGRPFILAGHSQGGAHVVTLLQSRIDGSPLAARMVAAYAIGYNLSEGDFGKTFKTLKPCDRPSSVGCVIGWNAVTPDLDRHSVAAMMEQRYVKLYGDDKGKRLLCINPLTFDRRKMVAGSTESKGALPNAPDAARVDGLVAQAVSAQCRDGLLVVSADPSLNLAPLPGGSLHFHDLGLFYADVREDANRRVSKWFRGVIRE